jgi:hypothetical protein
VGIIILKNSLRTAEIRKAGTKPAEITGVLDFVRTKLGFEPDAKQELVLRGGRRGIVNCTRQWGKSTVTAAKAVHRAYTQPGSLTLVLAPCGRQSGEFLLKAEEFVSRLGIKIQTDSVNPISIALPNGSRIVGLPGNEKTARGYSAVSLMLIDEAARVDDNLYRSVRPSLAVGDGDLWLMSTPNGKRGFFWEEWDQGGPEWERISVPATECTRISRRMMAEEQAKGDRWYRQEYMCEFTEREGAVFPQELIDAAMQDFEGLDL